MAPLRGASEARHSPSSSCSPPGGCRGPPPTCCGRGCVDVGAQHCPLGQCALWGLRAAVGVANPAHVPQRGALASRRCVLWGRRRGVPGGGAFRHCGERLSAGASPSPAARLLGGLPGPATRVLWVRVCECGGPALSPWLWAGGRAFYCCEGRPVSGAVPPPATRPPGRAVCVSWARLVRAWGPSTGPTPLTAVRGISGQAIPLPRLPALGWAVRARYPRAVGAGVRLWGPCTVPLACAPCGGRVPWGWSGTVPWGGGLPPL